MPEDKRGNPWSEDRLALAEEMWRQGYKASFIAEYCDTTRNAVIGMSHRKGWVRDVEPEPQKRVLPKKVFKPLVAKPRAIQPVPAKRLGKIRVMDLQDYHCRWPVSGAGAGTLFCGKGLDDGSVYCEEHHGMARGYGQPMRIPVTT
jgi:hypothetical protein